MMSNRTEKLEFVAELRLRQWARRNYVAAAERRDSDWHAVVVDEMQQMDRLRDEISATQSVVTSAGLVPLEPSRHDRSRVDRAHSEMLTPNIGRTTLSEKDAVAFIPYYA